MGTLVSIFKIDNKSRKYVEVYRIPKMNEEKVNMLLKTVNNSTPEEEIRNLFEGLCKVRTKSDFIKLRRKRLIFNLLFIAAITVWFFLLAWLMANDWL